jgi:multicomponent Na+:H+ antiporter subunit G
MAETIRMILTGGLLVIGAAFMFIAALSVIRMPDLFLRMSASTKAATLGAGLMLVGAAVAFNNLAITGRAVAIVLFLLITAPVSAHMLARAAYFDGVRLWEGTVTDEMRGRYDPRTHQLASQPAPIEMTVPVPSALVGKKVMELGLPAKALIVLVNRGRTSLVPSGTTILEAGDELLVVADFEVLEEVFTLLGVAPHERGGLRPAGGQEASAGA